MKISATNGPISSAFVERGIWQFSDACAWVQDVPYKRNSNKEDILIVLKESKGTCSSKHELIKRLADENGIRDCLLTLCMFRMSPENTPKIKDVLLHYGLPYIPEAHTFIKLDGAILDLTFPEKPPLLYLNDVLFTEEISANQIRQYKTRRHKTYVKEWCNKNEFPFSFKEVWDIREACIAALSKK